MKKSLNLIQTLNNLRYIRRTGPILFAGVPSDHVQTIAEHTFTVSNLVLLLGSKVKSVNVGNILMHGQIHDWAESIIGDMPLASKSYQSYFDEDIQSIYKSAEFKILNNFMSDAEIALPQINEQELSLLRLCDLCATTLELIDLKQKGHQHQWIEKMFVVNQGLMEKFDFDFIPELKDGFQKLFENGMGNEYLTKATDEQ